MRFVLPLALLASAAMSLRAHTYLYVSTGADQKIASYKLDPKSGELTAAGVIEVEGTPGALVVDPSKKHLFATLRSTGNLASFDIDPINGRLKLISTAPLGKDDNAAYVNVDRTGRWLFSVSYSGGKTVVHRIDDHGAIKTPPVQTIATVKTSHCAAVDRANRWVFVPHVSPNAIYQYRLDVGTGMLKETGKASGGAEKAGPRHLAFHPSESLAFTSNEEGNSITAYRLDDEAGLKPLQTLSSLPADFSGKSVAAEVKVHPSGQFVWVSNRGHDSLAGFAVEPKTGKLSALGQTPTEKTPRSFEFAPDGRFLYAGGEGTGKLAAYNVELETGKLTSARSYDVGKSVTWVLAVTLPAK